MAFIFFLVLAKIVNIENYIFSKIPIWGLLILMNGFLLTGIVISIYGVKANFPPRVENMLIFVSFFFLFFIAIKVINKYNINSQVIYTLGIIVAVVYVFLPKNEFQRDSNIKLVYEDIFIGKVFSYEKQVIQRDIDLKKCKGDCMIKPIQNPPRSLMFKDASTDANSYINKSIAIYYDLDSVRIEENNN